jgi:uncharacterized protein (TIGR02453 family)
MSYPISWCWGEIICTKLLNVLIIRQVYQEEVLIPLKELVIDLWPMMITIDQKFEVSPAPNKAISRIYRDTRFSKDKSPYKSNMWITFKRQSKDWKEAPCFFFEIFPDSYRYGMGFYSASKETMDKLREAIDSKPKEFLKIVSPLNSQKAFQVEGEKYKRILDSTKSSELNDWYQRKNVYIVCNKKIDAHLFNRKLINELVFGFKFLAPVYHYLWKIKNA